MNPTEEPTLKPDDLDYVDESQETWRGHEEESSVECCGCGCTIESGVVGRYCSECIYLMER